MKLTFASQKFHSVKKFLPLLSFFITMILSILSGLYLFRPLLLGAISSTVINMGLDPQRSLLIAAMVMTAAAALLGALLGRRKFASLLGASLIFWFLYLSDFIQTQLQPFHDPGGHLEPLNSSALLSRGSMMLALGLVSAYAGSAVGVALSETVLDPPYRLLRVLWQRRPIDGLPTSPLHTVPSPRPSRPFSIFQQALHWLGAISLVVLVVLVSGSGNLFMFSPDVDLHSPPTISGPGHANASIHGTIVQDSLVSPALSGITRQFMIYLPPSYTTQAGQTKRYPALYLLHGSPGSDKDWFTGGRAAESADTLIATGKTAELLLVLPDGNGRPGATSEWGNSFDKHQLIENYVANDLVKYVDSHYRTIADAAHRGIGGLSMGGFGAANIGVHHPDIFSVVISLGGYYRAEGAIWGNNSAYIQQNSPIALLPQDQPAHKLHFYLGTAPQDQPYYNYTQQFIQELKKLKMPYQLDVQQGHHSWVVWQTQMYNALTWIRWGS